MKIKLNGSTFAATPIKGGLRLTDVTAKPTALDRYGILRMTESEGTALTVAEDGLISDGAGKPLTTLSVSRTQEGWTVSLTLREGEQLYGLGDVTRDRLDKRGYRCRMWVTNVKRYAPIPFLMSSEGWAVTVNTTFEHFIDCGATDEGALKISSRYSAPDLTFFAGKDYTELLRLYTAFSGRPAMLPRYAMGLTYVANTDANQFEVMEDAINFRREDFPCDIFGLEPGWMDYIYDYSTHKKWSTTRFPIAPWAGKSNNFMGALERLGFKLSLWLCSEYDLTYYEEQLAGATREEKEDESAEAAAASFEVDEHLKNLTYKTERLTDPNEPWFDHLKKFVDQGAMAFKLDGSNQVLDHPDRLWGNGMTDCEAHNLYPLILSKQMSLGFTEHTGKRSMIYTAGGYTGVQQYAATWAGDTGGDFGTMISLLNHGMSGHSNTSCDMDISCVESVHYGFLQPWCQLNNWKYFRQPWFETKKGQEHFAFYDKLRYSLVPYFYTVAHEAYETGLPIIRALPLMYPDDAGAYERYNVYHLGRDLLVGAYLDKSRKTVEGEEVNCYLPRGRWIDFWTGETFEGGKEIFYRVPEDRGGALFVREGAILPTVKPTPSIPDEGYDEYELIVFGDAAEGTLYSDDGITLGYTKGEYVLADLKREGDTVTVTERGSFPGMPAHVRYTAKTHDGTPLTVVVA